MDNPEVLGYAGQVIIDDATIISSNGLAFNVSTQIAGFSLFEDIWSSFLTAEITLFETIDLLNLFPLVGEERINLAFHTPGIDKMHFRKQQFYIYNMSDMEPAGDRSNIYKLHLISIDAIVDINTKISKTYSGQVSDIARKILTEPGGLNTSKKINIEPSPAVTKFTPTFWTPTTCLRYVADTSYNINNSPSYLFFENSQGLNYVSLDSLYKGDVQHKFKQNNYTREIDAPTGKAWRNPALDFQTILDFSIPEGFDYIDRCNGGMYGSTMITVDPITKKYTSRNFHGSTIYNRQNHLNEFSLISNKAIARSAQVMIYMPKHYGNFNGFPDVTNASVMQQRTSILKQATSFKVRIEVNGRTDYTVGQKINLDIPSKHPIAREDNETRDMVSSGNYIIAAIRHDITREKHICIFELMKDSLIIDLNRANK